MITGILIQARLSSSRYPSKMLDKVGNVTLLEYVYHRCKTSKLANKVIVITSTDKSDDALYDLCLDKEIPLFRGDLNNVLERYICAANENKIELICRVIKFSELAEDGSFGWYSFFSHH